MIMEKILSGGCLSKMPFESFRKLWLRQFNCFDIYLKLKVKMQYSLTFLRKLINFLCFLKVLINLEAKFECFMGSFVIKTSFYCKWFSIFLNTLKPLKDRLGLY